MVSAQRWLGISALVIALAAMPLTACSPDRSAESFCEKLNSANEEMRGNVEGASPEWSSQLGVAMENLGEFTKLLHDLDDRAPDEIRSDMHVTVEVWEKQQDALANAADNPLGALASTVFATMFNSASFGAVDRYALDNCGSSVFGTIAGEGEEDSSEAAAEQADTGACPDGTYDSASLLENETTFGDLTYMLDSLGKSTDSSLAAAAKALTSATSDLSPPPATSVEAFGRLGFGTVDRAGLLKALNAAYLAACGSELFSENQLDYVKGEITPAPDMHGVRIGDIYGQCGGESIGWRPPFTQVFRCGAEVQQVDLQKGTVVRAGGFPDTETRLHLAGDAIAWTEVITKPATGLAQPTWTATLHVRGLDNSAPVAAELAKGTGEGDTSDHIVAAMPNHILVAVSDRLIMLDKAGKQLWSKPVDSDTTAEPVTGGTVLAGGQVVEADTGKVVAGRSDESGQVTTDGCGNSAVFSTWDRTLWVNQAGAEAATAEPVEVSSSYSVSDTGLILESSGSLDGLTPDGKVSWSIPAEVVASSVTLGRWIVVTNPSGNKVLVSAVTGKDSGAEHPDVEDALFAADDAITFADPATDTAIVEGSGLAVRLSFKTMCGS